jgi:hypothetical protein
MPSIHNKLLTNTHQLEHTILIITQPSEKRTHLVAIALENHHVERGPCVTLLLCRVVDDGFKLNLSPKSGRDVSRKWFERTSKWFVAPRPLEVHTPAA